MITSRIKIQADAARIWQALTDKEQMKEWYFDIPDFELKEGAVFNFYEPGEARKYHHRCVIKSIMPSKKLSHSWTHPSHSKGESQVTWLLEEKDGRTEVSLYHEGIENLADAGPEFAPENYQMGWNGLLAALKNYVNGLSKISFEIEIEASAEKVWDILWDKENYKRWTSVFCEGSYYTGVLEPGSRVHFLEPGGSGMYSDIIFCTPPHHLLIQHIGEIKGGKEQPLDDAADKWTGAFEQYSLEEKDQKTMLRVEVDTSPEHVEFMNEDFPKGLQKVKKLAEGLAR